MNEFFSTRLFARLPASGLRGRLRWILVYTWFSLALFVVLGVVLAVFTAERENWRAHQQEASRNSAIIIDGYLSQILNTLSLVNSFGSDEFVDSPKTLQSLLADQPSIREIVYLDAEANIIASLERSNALLSDQFTIGQSEWFLNAKAGKTYFSRVQVSAENEPFMIVAIPSQDGGVLAVRVEMQILWDVVRDIRFDDLGKIYVANRDGRVVAHTDKEIVLENRLMPDLERFQEILAAPGLEWSGRMADFSGSVMVGTAVPIKTTGWVVITVLPLQTAYASTLTALWLTPLVLFLFSMTSTHIIEQVVRRLFLIPIDNLGRGADEVGQGNLDYQVPVMHDDELGQFTVAFNGMAGRLKEQHEKLELELRMRQQAELLLRELNEDLENRVANRTAELADSLREKEVLLKEVHHRVKNNLQVVSSLLSLQARKATDEHVTSLLVDSQSRVHSMSLIHEKLYQSESLEFVDFGVYIHTLAAYLFQTYNTRAGIRFEVKADAVPLSLNQAVPCGLFVNEVITNALKYAFTGRNEGLICAEVHSLPDGFVQLRIADNGRGMEAQSEAPSTSLGTQLIQSLAIQLDAALQVNRSPGVEYILTFKGEDK